MKEQIKHAESKVEFFKEQLLNCHESMSHFYFEKAKSWEAHRADLVRKHE